MCYIHTSSPKKANVILHSATFLALFNFQDIEQIGPYILLPILIENSRQKGKQNKTKIQNFEPSIRI